MTHKYFLNGKATTSIIIAKRKAKLDRTFTVKSHYYTAPFTEDEKHANTVQAIANSEFFQRMNENREELEKRHG